jgi:hypothetical protein
VAAVQVQDVAGGGRIAQPVTDVLGPTSPASDADWIVRAIMIVFDL